MLTFPCRRMRHLWAINVARYEIKSGAIPLANVADMLHRSGYPALIYQWCGSAQARGCRAPNPAMLPQALLVANIVR